MKNVRIEHQNLPDVVIQALATRDAALWVGLGLDESEESVAILRQLIGQPWKLVLCEATGERLAAALTNNEVRDGTLVHQRGFIHLIAADPEGVQLPPRVLPVYLLNGRENALAPEERISLGRQGKLRRRLNMINELRAALPRVVVLVGNGQEQPITDFMELWTEESFRSLVTLVSPSDEDAARIDEWLQEPQSPPAVDHCRAPLAAVIRHLTDRLAVTLPASQIVIRMRDALGVIKEVDITNCELVERPLLQSYETIQVRDLQLIQSDELGREELTGFFDRSTASWRPYAAGLPWQRDRHAWRSVRETLERVSAGGAPENKVLTIVSESGAGGTTLAHTLAFEAASAGYPTLVARPVLLKADALELTSFLYRVHLASASAYGDVAVPEAPVGEEDTRFETPFLIVYDVQHWEAQWAELRTFVRKLTEAGRAAVVLTVASPSVPIDLARGATVQRIASLTHEITLPEALNLGEHLNRFLRRLGRERSPRDWRRFWEAHRPNYVTSSVAHFWIALEFWLKGQIDLNESIQSWLYGSFRDAEIADDVRVILLEIAALTIERQPLPEGLMPSTNHAHRLPYSELIERVRINVPSLALVRESSGVQKMWALAHDLLGRYLLTSTFYDNAMLNRLGLAEATDPVELRLLLLRRIACQRTIELRPFRPLALEFAVKILKLDADGNQEFIVHWRQALDILKSMPSGVRETSRIFNHHVAVSLRRIANQEEFNVEPAERKVLLEEAIDRLQYALSDLSDEEGEESDLNLYNSLALAYQNLADVERKAGASAERLNVLRVKATEATRNALQEDPSNHFVLETTARNLIQNGEVVSDQAAASATEALGYIYQAITLERSTFRQNALTQLANRALRLLNSASAERQVQHLIRSGNPLGSLAESWLLLTENVDSLDEYDLADMPSSNISNALTALEHSAQKSNWMILRFRYDLLTAARPRDFAGQLRLLDELEGTEYRMPLQVRLEHAILLHQENRHMEANRKFQQLRQDYRRFEAFVDVPSRLFWLRTDPHGPPRICDARVIENRGQRSIAKVRELKNESVPFVPQEFGLQHTMTKLAFKCSVTFGRNGPFLKPPYVEARR